MKDKMLFIVVCFLFILGCSYNSATSATMSGYDVKFPIGITAVKGDQLNATFNRVMNVCFMCRNKNPDAEYMERYLETMEP